MYQNSSMYFQSSSGAMTDSATSQSQDSELFKTMPSSMSIKEKIFIKVKRFDNNYFLECDLNEIEFEIVETPALNAYIKPNRKVTSSELSKFISRTQKTKIKMISWCLINVEEYSEKFRDCFDKNTFKTQEECEIMAREIYSKHCSKYIQSKAVISNEDLP